MGAVSPKAGSEDAATDHQHRTRNPYFFGWITYGGDAPFRQQKQREQYWEPNSAHDVKVLFYLPKLHKVYLG